MSQQTVYNFECSRCGSISGDYSCQYGLCPIETQIFHGGFVTPKNQIKTCCVGYKKVSGSNQTQLLVTQQSRTAQLAETYAWIYECSNTKGLCGCTECNELHKLACSKGVKDFELLACKLMNLDTNEFYWDEGFLGRLGLMGY
jgi:hypothetical protein